MGLLALGIALIGIGCRAPEGEVVQAESELISVVEKRYWPADATKGSQFAGALAMDGARLLVGSRYGYTGTVYTGTAYIFERSGTTWSQQAKLTASDGAKNDDFGWFLDLAGDVAVVGARNKNVGQGAAYIFERNSSGVWKQTKKLVDPTSGNGSFGLDIGTDGSTAVVGAHTKNQMRGAAYVYSKSGSTWSSPQTLLASDGANYDQFGTSTDVEGNTMVVGACVDDHKAIDAGSVYVFMKSGSTWTETQKLTANDALIYAHFGKSVDLDGDTLLVGANQDYNYTGSAYVFTRSGTVWSPQAKLTAPDRTKDDDFAYAVDLDGDTAIIGAAWDDDRGSASGSAYLYNRSGATWSLLGKLTASDGDASDFYGEAVAMDGMNAAVGARGDEYTLGFNAGTLYAYQVSGYAPTCTSGSSCPSGFCVDGYCCDSACGGNVTTDCQACSKAAGAAANGSCGTIASGTVCRAAGGDCDTAEKCDGVKTSCPADVKKASGAVCRAKAGDCDKQEVCDGAAATCPANTYLPAATVCRVASGACDKVESCTGSAATCPTDKVQPVATVCRAAVSTCDVQEACDGTNKVCPADAYTPAGTVCRASGGTCDPEEKCTGASTSCPGDLVSPAGTLCRAATGDCDLKETCDGAKKVCPTDLVLAKGFICRAVQGICDVAEACDGATKACPINAYMPPLTVCRAAAGTCDDKEVCTGGSPACPADSYKPYGVTCRPAKTECDWEETCKGNLPSCPQDYFKPTGTPCSGGTGQCAAGKCWLPPDGGAPVDAGVKDARVDLNNSGVDLNKDLIKNKDLQTQYDYQKKWDTKKVDLNNSGVDLNKDLIKNKDLQTQYDKPMPKVDLQTKYDYQKKWDTKKLDLPTKYDLPRKTDLATVKVDLPKKWDLRKDTLEQQDGPRKLDGPRKWDLKKLDGPKQKPDILNFGPHTGDEMEDEGLCSLAPGNHVPAPPLLLLLLLIPILRRRP